jgi:hypothetical protein
MESGGFLDLSTIKMLLTLSSNGSYIGLGMWKKLYLMLIC